MSNINWNLYKYFIKVYETQNYHRAAEELSVSPSAVLQNIKELSNQLGIVLFTASRKGVEPTDDAKNLYSQIKKSTETILVVENKFKTSKNDFGGVVRIAAHSLFAKNQVFGYLKEFNTKYPTIQIEIVASGDVSLIKQKKLDFIIDWDWLFRGTDLVLTDLLDKSFRQYFVATKQYLKEHNLEQKITKAGLEKQPIIERSELMEKFCKYVVTDFTPLEINTQAGEQIFETVNKSLGIGFFSELVLKSFYNPEIVRLSVTDMKIPPAKLVCAHVGNLSASAQAFLDGFVKFVGGGAYRI